MSGSESDAWVAWSAIAEPLDPAAAALLAVLGPVEALAWLRECVGRPQAALAGLIERVGPDVEPRSLARIVRSASTWGRRLDRADPAMHRHRCAAVGGYVLTPADDGWPEAVHALGAAAPMALYVRGGPLRSVLEGSIALVGSRAATAYGSHVAAEIAAGVVADDRTVVSGGAFGIDAAAHRSAIAAGGRTVAIMAGGVDRWYPAGTASLRDDVLRNGCVVSEVPPGSAPHRSRFLSRNRLIACAAATVVVEAAYRSGALSTAHHAMEIARPVGAVPGPVTSAASAGAHRLIRELGAVLVTSAADVLELVKPLDAVPQPVDPDTTGPIAFASREQRAAYDAIPRGGSALDQISTEGSLELGDTRRALAGLVAAGKVSYEGGIYRRIL
ncbi:DNA-processing protein DprA [Demequina capsici]|uniref:DNA-processing protein DprA n=1 Tax=Demequina capsici TaxID=3075620 RepID=A0AA96FAD8_9MICO|nr:DNA-processing protein DprA [Demequina sp. PMTSA13]WNM26302.1 DNA-processing protein DprA [Demequina sp. PMTSA13]